MVDGRRRPQHAIRRKTSSASTTTHADICGSTTIETCTGSLIRAALASVADTAIVPAQDLLGLGSEARMNQPGTASGNWRWQLSPGQLTTDIIRRLGVLTETYERTLRAV